MTARRLATCCALLLLGTLLLVVAPTAMADEKEAIKALREFLNPAQEFVWKPRKRLLAAFETLDRDPLRDIAYLRELTYQGRHFEGRFSDELVQRVNDITEFEETRGIYRNVKSEVREFTYTVPRSYPRERELNSVPRVVPYPFLLCLPQAEDKGDHPGAACLERRYPRSTSAGLYDDWLTLAPVTPRAEFLDEDGAIRHRFLTSVLTDFWRRYHLDFDRIVVDGTEAAAALCAMFPHVFAGLVLRGGEIPLEDVSNYASVPVYVVGNAYLEEDLRGAGHPQVTGGDTAGIGSWIEKRRRHVPASFAWTVRLPEQLYPNWILLQHTAADGQPRSLSVQVVDTKADPNTIKIQAKGIGAVSLFLNDDIVDLDREVRVVYRGEEIYRKALERSLDQVFVEEPAIRKNMNFGWLYPVVVSDLVLDPSLVPPPAGESQPSDERAGPSAAARRTARIEAERYFLFGRPDLMDTVLFPLVDAEGGGEAPDPELNLALALRDLWWRRTDDVRIREWHARAAAGATGVLAEQYRWILGGGVGPYPHADSPADDPWPALTALVLERLYREHLGHAHLPEVSPLQTFVPHPEWEAWFDEWRAYAAGSLMRDAYRGPDAADLVDDASEADAVGRRNLALAIGLGVLFIALVFGAGHRMGRLPRQGPPSQAK